MPSLKLIRKRIISVKSTQKITRAMKMVAGARLNRAQQRITELRPYAVKTHDVLAEITAAAVVPPPVDPEAASAPAVAKSAVDVPPITETEGGEAAQATGYDDHAYGDKPAHPLLVERVERRVLMLVLTSDRGLCGAFNTNINKRAEREWRTRTEQGQDVKLVIVGRKGRDYFTRRDAPILAYLPGIWDKLTLDTAREVGATILAPFNKNEVDALYLVYNEFKSALSQDLRVERLLPVERGNVDGAGDGDRPSESGRAAEFLYEPTREALLENLVPMYLDISILRALYESQASELGARMTAMDAATKNAKEMIGALTLQYNRARQAAITKELMEIIGGSEALKE